MTGTVLWEPPADVRETSRMGHYMSWLEREHGLRFDDYAALWEWSVTDLNAFWQNISTGVDAIETVPESRMGSLFFEEEGAAHTTAAAVDRFYCRRGGFIDNYA